MLKSIKISNFRSIDEEVELSFEPAIAKELNEYYLTHDNLLKLSLIYGANASGKTNIIKAIGFLRNFIFTPPKNKEELIDITPFKFKDNVDENSKFILEFIEDKLLFIYEIELNRKRVVYEKLKFKNLALKKPRFALIFERNEHIHWGNKIKVNKSEEETIKLNTLPNMSLFSGYLRVNVKIEEIETVLKFLKRILPPIYPTTDLLLFGLQKLEENEVTKEEIIKILKNADFAIDDFSIEEKEIDEDFIKFLKQIGKENELNSLKKIEIWFNHFKKYQLEFKEESQGTQRFYQLAIILALLAKNSYIIPIDEIENSLHPDLLKFFILIFLSNAKNSQIILTTHTRELLLETDILRKDVIWFCDKNKNGSTDLFSLSDFGNEIKDSSPIYNYYKYGKIGATPNIKSFLGLFDENQ
jgi:AAA15 family ATPase/GTPase